MIDFRLRVEKILHMHLLLILHLEVLRDTVIRLRSLISKVLLLALSKVELFRLI